jgi:hypothetical protein
MYVGHPIPPLSSNLFSFLVTRIFCVCFAVSNRRSPSPPFALGIADGPRNGRYRQRRQQPVGFGGETLAAAGGRVGNADRAAGYPLRSISRPRLVPPPDSAYQAVGQDKLTEGYTGGGMGGPNPTSHAFGPRRFGRLRTPHAAASGRLHCPAMHRSLTFQNNFGAKNVDLTLTPFVLLLKEPLLSMQLDGCTMI